MNFSALRIIFLAFRPVFYFVNPIISRLSDFIALLLLSPIKNKISTRVFVPVACLLMYLIVILVSLINFAFSRGGFVISDFFEIARPIYWILGLLFGASATGSIGFQSVCRIIVGISILNTIAGILMLLFPESLKFLYVVYNVPNLYFHGRPGGIAYTHTEFVALNVLGLLALYISNLKLKKVITIILVIGSFVPMSKGGVLFVFVFLFSALCFHRLFFSVLFAIFFASTVYLAFDYLMDLAKEQVPYLYWGFHSLFELLKTGYTTDGSIGPRFNDWVVAINYSFTDLAYLIGNSPMRGYEKDLSYIESTVPNVLFRFGFLGLFYYYGAMFVSSCLVAKRHRRLVFAFFFSLVVADCTANFSESIKFMTLISIFLGALLQGSPQRIIGDHLND